MSTNTSGAAPDLQPGNKAPVGPSRAQPATNKQKDFVERLGASDEMPGDASKGEASDIISANLDRNGGTGGGAADDTTPGKPILYPHSDIHLTCHHFTQARKSQLDLLRSNLPRETSS